MDPAMSEEIEAVRDMVNRFMQAEVVPVMDGYEFLGHLRRLPGGDRPKVVFCTTENGVDHISRALHAGANEYIMKPFDKDIVQAKFQEVGLM